MRHLLQLLERPVYRYLLIGGSVYIFELIIITVAQKSGASAVWSVTIGFILGTGLSFFLQKLVTFRDRRMHHRILLPQLLATSLLILWNLGFSVLLTKLLQRYLPTVVIRTIALLITTLWNFYLYKTRIFKTDNELAG